MIELEPQVAESFERLYPISDVTEDWDDVLGRSARPVPLAAPAVPRSRLAQWRPTRRVLLVGAAALVTVALAALTVASPWRGGPTIIDRAAAALAAPAPGEILHESIALHSGPFNPEAAVNVQVWLDSAPPHRFRVTFDRPQRVEAGGTVGGLHALSYDDAGNVLDPVALGFRVSQSDLDPVGFIRTALASGQAQPDGRTTIRGREVLRIRVTSQAGGRRVPIAFYYVDAHTYRPARIVIPPGDHKPRESLHGLPLLFVLALPYGLPDAAGNHFTLFYDFAKYRYLEPTTGNRKLTDIRAQHPGARIV
jgi:hypothetical protein